MLASATMPAVAIEIGNLNNDASVKTLADPEFQTKLASAIAAGIEQFALLGWRPQTMTAPRIPRHLKFGLIALAIGFVITLGSVRGCRRAHPIDGSGKGTGGKSVHSAGSCRCTSKTILP